MYFARKIQDYLVYAEGYSPDITNVFNSVSSGKLNSASTRMRASVWLCRSDTNIYESYIYLMGEVLSQDSIATKLTVVACEDWFEFGKKTLNSLHQLNCLKKLHYDGHFHRQCLMLSSSIRMMPSKKCLILHRQTD